MTPEEIERLVTLCAGAGIGEIELAEQGFTLRLRIERSTDETSQAAGNSPNVDSTFKGVRAPGVGVFRPVHPSTGCPVADTGQPVRKGDTVAVLQVGSLLRSVVAPYDGVLGPALTPDGSVVGYGTPLYALT